jgi:site-specific recombinase XerD
MLKDVYVDAAALRRLRSSVLGAHLEEFCTDLQGRGYGRATIRDKLGLLGRLARWMEAKGLKVHDLDARCAKSFVAWRTRRGLCRRGVECTVLQLVDHLCSKGVVDRLVPTPDESSTTLLLARYEDHLRRERALVPCTIAAYRSVVGPFVDECMPAGVDSAATLDSVRVRGFLLARTRGVPPRRAQAIAAALRSFLRFLFLRGHTRTDLSLAVPTVRRWRLSAVPRHLSAPDVERLLAACDRTSVTGRRDHALLLLLARLGLRAGEVLRLELGDLRWREGEIVVRGKGFVHDRLPLLPEVGAAIALYLHEDRPPSSCRRVFLCRKAPHRGFSHPSSVSTLVARALARAGLDPAMHGAHVLRHSLATTMIRRGASLSEIGEVLRHRSSTTTEIYAKLDFGALRGVALPWPAAGGDR